MSIGEVRKISDDRIHDVNAPRVVERTARLRTNQVLAVVHRAVIMPQLVGCCEDALPEGYSCITTQSCGERCVESFVRPRSQR